MTDASIPRANTSAAAHRPRSNPGKASPRRHRTTDEDILNHYLKRLDPQVAASFTSEQRDAIKTLIGPRELAKHAVEVRRSIPLPSGRRFYLVFLLGREQRRLSRLYSEGAHSGRFNLLFYLALSGLFFAPVLALLIAGAL